MFVSKTFDGISLCKSTCSPSLAHSCAQRLATSSGRVAVPAIVGHLESIIGALESPPIIMGHSMGGLLTQILLDHGYGSARVAIDSVPAEGIKVAPVSQIRALFTI
jgi:pimeloyl-ACP methyl ester carboxylesterase